jgi:hypothetical protein
MGTDMKKTFILFVFYFLIKMGASAQQKDEKPVGIIPDSFKYSRKGLFVPNILKSEKKNLSLKDISASIKSLDTLPFETDLEEIQKLKEALEKERFISSEAVKPIIPKLRDKVYTVKKMRIVKRSSKKKKRPCNCP